MAQVHDRLGEGQVVNIDLDPERSTKSHNHQFGFVGTAWDNLPENTKHEKWAMNTTTLRKYALIQTGHCDTEMMAMGSETRALRMQAVMSRIATRMEGFAITNIEGTVVYCHTPHSQSLKAMGGERFKRSKQDILEFLANLIGVSPKELAQMGKKGTA
jgi:hypothetical protein